MDLKNFKVLSKDQYDALSEREQVKYELQLEEYKAQESKRLAKESASEAIKEMKAELKKEREDELKGLSDANEKALKELVEKHELKMEEVVAQLKRAKVGEIGERMKGVPEMIIEKLSTPEGEAMIKSFFKGQKLELEVSEKAMLKPAGGVADQFIDIVGPGHDVTHARDVIPVFPTLADLIKYVQFTVDPALGYDYVPEGGLKPDLGYISTVKQAEVVKIAGLLTVSEEMLSDIVGFRAWIAYELPKAYLDFEDMQIFKGTGGDGSILGLWTQAANQGYVGSVTAASNVIDKIASAITEVRIKKRNTSAVFLSPTEYMEVFINKGNTDEYTYPVMLSQSNVLTIGGVPIYWSNNFSEGQGLVGDFSRGAAIFQRRAMDVAYSDQHADNFARNLVTIRLEGRIALVIRYPEAFLKLTLAAPAA